MRRLACKVAIDTLALRARPDAVRQVAWEAMCRDALRTAARDGASIIIPSVVIDDETDLPDAAVPDASVRRLRMVWYTTP